MHRFAKAQPFEWHTGAAGSKCLASLQMLMMLLIAATAQLELNFRSVQLPRDLQNSEEQLLHILLHQHHLHLSRAAV